MRSEAVFDQRVGAGDAAVVVAEIAPARVQILALQVEQPLFVGRGGQAQADHRRVAVVTTAGFVAVFTGFGIQAAFQLGPFGTDLQAEVEGRRIDHGVVVHQAGQLELGLALGEAPGGDGDVVVRQILSQRRPAVLVVLEVVEDQPVPLAHPEHAVDARDQFLAAEVEVLGKAQILALEIGSSAEHAVGVDVHGAQPEGEAVRFLRVCRRNAGGAENQHQGKGSPKSHACLSWNNEQAFHPLRHAVDMK